MVCHMPLSTSGYCLALMTDSWNNVFLHTESRLVWVSFAQVVFHGHSDNSSHCYGWVMESDMSEILAKEYRVW